MTNPVILDILSETIVSVTEFLMLATKTITFGIELFQLEWLVLADELIICGSAPPAPPDTAIKDNK